MPTLGGEAACLCDAGAVALRRGFALFDPESGAPPRYLQRPDAEPSGNPFNEGKCDAVDGAELGRVPPPASQITNCSFGG